MSTEILPTYPDLKTLDSQKLNEIEQKCYASGHLDTHERLLDRIAIDLANLNSLGVAKEDIYRNHRNMVLKAHHLDEYNVYLTNQIHKHPHDLYDHVSKYTNIQWCLQHVIVNEIKLNGQHLLITCLIWGGAEQCPIEKSFSNKYHGYERGDSDWLVTNLDNNQSIWVPDLVPAQIGMFGFFQSPSSPYRIDIKQYINVFGKPTEIIPIHTIDVWSFSGGPVMPIDLQVSSESINYFEAMNKPVEPIGHIGYIFKLDSSEEKYQIKKEINCVDYQAYLCIKISDNTEILVVNFKNSSWDNKQITELIIFDIPYSSTIFMIDKYTTAQVGKKVVLDGRDDKYIMDKKYMEWIKNI